MHYLAAHICRSHDHTYFWSDFLCCVQLQNLETELDSVKEAAAPTTATDGDEQGSQTNVAGNETDAEGGQEAATDNLASESDDKPADGEGTKETADGDDAGKEDSVESSGNKTEAKTDQDEDSPEKVYVLFNYVTVDLGHENQMHVRRANFFT